MKYVDWQQNFVLNHGQTQNAPKDLIKKLNDMAQRAHQTGNESCQSTLKIILGLYQGMLSDIDDERIATELIKNQVFNTVHNLIMVNQPEGFNSLNYSEDLEVRLLETCQLFFLTFLQDNEESAHISSINVS